MVTIASWGPGGRSKADTIVLYIENSVPHPFLCLLYLLSFSMKIMTTCWNCSFLGWVLTRVCVPCTPHKHHPLRWINMYDDMGWKPPPSYNEEIPTHSVLGCPGLGLVIGSMVIGSMGYFTDPYKWGTWKT